MVAAGEEVGVHTEELRAAGDVAGPGHPSRIPTAFPVLLGVLAAALVLNSLLGPLVLDRVDYPFSETLVNQLVGLEVVTLLLVVPLLVAAAVLARRDQRAAPLLAFGPTAYTAYMFVQYVLGPEYVQYHAIAFLHLAMTSLSGGLALWAWSLSAERSMPRLTRGQRRRWAAVLLALAAFVLLRYSPAILGALSTEPIPAEFAGEPTFYWSIVLLDLALVVPAAVLAAVALLRGSAAGQRGLYAVLGWFALVPPSVASMAVVMLIRDDPNASAVTAVMLTVAAALFAAVAVVAFRPLLRDS